MLIRSVTTATGNVTERVCSTFENDRDKKGVNTVDHAPRLTPGAVAAPSGTPPRVSMIELDDWILAVSLNDHEKMVGSIERVMVDSGAALSVCPHGIRLRSHVQPLEACDQCSDRVDR